MRLKFDRWMEKRLEACFWFFPFVLLHVYLILKFIRRAVKHKRQPQATSKVAIHALVVALDFFDIIYFEIFFLFIIFGHYLAAFVKSSGADNNPLILHLQHYVNQIPAYWQYTALRRKKWIIPNFSIFLWAKLTSWKILVWITTKK